MKNSVFSIRVGMEVRGVQRTVNHIGCPNCGCSSLKSSTYKQDGVQVVECDNCDFIGKLLPNDYKVYSISDKVHG